MRHLLVGISLCILSTACVEEEQQIIPIPFNQVTLTDGFWKERMKTEISVTVPFSVYQSAPAVERFRRCAAFVQVNPPNCRKHIVSSVRIYIR